MSRLLMITGSNEIGFAPATSAWLKIKSRAAEVVLSFAVVVVQDLDSWGFSAYPTNNQNFLDGR